jgi:hypothetical protein
VLIYCVKLDSVDGSCDETGDQSQLDIVIEEGLGSIDANVGEVLDLVRGEESG